MLVVSPGRRGWEGDYQVAKPNTPATGWFRFFHGGPSRLLKKQSGDQPDTSLKDHTKVLQLAALKWVSKLSDRLGPRKALNTGQDFDYNPRLPRYHATALQMQESSTQIAAVLESVA